jgi:hypothetical protein
VTSLVFPVGHYLGPHFSESGATAGQHRVRVGPSLRWLGSEPEPVAWSLAHGIGELADDRPWTRGVLLEWGWQLADTDLTDPVAGLLDRRLLVEVDPTGTGAAAEFAKGYQLRALMLALGRDPEEPETVMLGMAAEPAVALSEFGYEVWRASQRLPSLWDTCQTAGSPLTELLSELHGLLAAGVAYLDTVEAEGELSDVAVKVH